jgi:transcriptional regulator with XRE-family HTH domain
LREIEEATGKSVSNAYLSQLEKGHIKKPSPNILYSLANVYSVPYETLMEKAGYIADGAIENNSPQLGNRMATFVDKTLTKEEEEALLEYLAFLRSKK